MYIQKACSIDFIYTVDIRVDIYDETIDFCYYVIIHTIGFFYYRKSTVDFYNAKWSIYFPYTPAISWTIEIAIAILLQSSSQMGFLSIFAIAI